MSFLVSDCKGNYKATKRAMLGEIADKSFRYIDMKTSSDIKSNVKIYIRRLVVNIS